MKFNLVLKALSHPIRREIVATLREGPMTAGDLAARFNVSKPTMSTHFAALKDADLVFSERDGVSIYYALNATVAEEALSEMMDLLRVGEAPAAAKSKSRRRPA